MSATILSLISAAIPIPGSTTGAQSALFLALTLVLPLPLFLAWRSRPARAVPVPVRPPQLGCTRGRGDRGG